MNPFDMFRLTLCIPILLLLSCNFSNESGLAKNTTEEEPTDYMFMQRAYPKGEIKTEAYAKAIRWAERHQTQDSRNTVWEFVGPTNIGGRITDVEIPVDHPNTYYVGAASGGIFRTTNGGDSWTPIFDDHNMLSIGDLEISRNNSQLIWTGTGEVNAGGGSLAYDGNGVYKSTDGGWTWENMDLPKVGSIGKILIHPQDDQTVFVGAMGPLFRNDPHRGVYRSNDGGNTWEQVLYISDSTGIIDMAIHPEHGDTLYAAAWERIRRPNRRRYGGLTSGIYRSMDGGEHWDELTEGLPSLPQQKGRISIDIARSNPSVLYARYVNAIGEIEGVYSTENGGDSWTEVSSQELPSVGFNWWFSGISIDPGDEHTIYNVGFLMYKSEDGGQSWKPTFEGVHVDQHALAFNPSIPGEVLLGNDGGLYISPNGGKNWSKFDRLPITQFYRICVDPQNADRVYGGSQDNGTMRTLAGGQSDWNRIRGGDGFQPLVDPTNSNIIYTLTQRGSLKKSVDGGASFSFALNGIDFTDRNNWDTPIAIDPSNSQILYYGTQRLYRTTNGTGEWLAISPDLSNGPHAGNLTFGTITSISVSPLDSDVIYAGTDDGNVWVSTDWGLNWNEISANLPNRWVTKVLASPDDVQTVYVTFSGYRYGTDDGHVFKSVNGGATWQNISSNLPDIPVNDILKDRFGNLYLGTDVGVMASSDEGQDWQPVGANMPSAIVTDMQFHKQSDFLYVGTYGRSIYKMKISENPVHADHSQSKRLDVQMYPNPASHQVYLAFPQSIRPQEVRLYDQMGRLVYKRKLSDHDQEHTIGLQSIPRGNYYARLSGMEGTWTEKLIVE